MKHSTLAVLGGTGFTGQFVIKEAISRGYQVKVLARDKNKVEQHSAVQVIEGDALNVNALKELVTGANAVVSTLGPSGINQSFKLAKQNGQNMLCYNTTRLLMPLLEQNNISDYILMGGAGLQHPADNNNFIMHFLLKKVAPVFLGVLSVDRHQELELLFESQLNWTIARCGRLMDEAKAKPYKANATKFQGGQIAVQNIARFMMDELETPRFNRQAVYLAN